MRDNPLQLFQKSCSIRIGKEIFHNHNIMVKFID